MQSAMANDSQLKYSMAKSARHVYGLPIRKSQGLGKKKCDML
jgi:hypothetical protein